MYRGNKANVMLLWILMTSFSLLQVWVGEGGDGVVEAGGVVGPGAGGEGDHRAADLLALLTKEEQQQLTPVQREETGTKRTGQKLLSCQRKTPTSQIFIYICNNFLLSLTYLGRYTFRYTSI